MGADNKCNKSLFALRPLLFLLVHIWLLLFYITSASLYTSRPALSSKAPIYKLGYIGQLIQEDVV